MNIAAGVITVAVWFLVGIMRMPGAKRDLGVDFSFLPPIHALLNTLAAFFLILALYFIKNKQVENHRKAIYAALTCSVLFLVCYVLYHFTTPEIRYGDIDHDRLLSDMEKTAAGSMRTVYLLVLSTHIVLAALSLPFILLTFNRAYTGSFERHKKMARWVYPVWLYVAITGPICYLMLKPYY